MIHEHERVVLKRDIPEEGLRAGDVGVVVHIHRNGMAFEVEFLTLSGDTAAVVTVKKQLVRAVREKEITHAREYAVA